MGFEYIMVFWPRTLSEPIRHRGVTARQQNDAFPRKRGILTCPAAVRPWWTRCPSFIAGHANAATVIVAEQYRTFRLGPAEGDPFPERVFRPAGGRKRSPKRPLAHVRSPRDNRVIAQRTTAQIAPKSHQRQIQTAAGSPPYQGLPHLGQGSRTRMDHW